MIEWRSEGQVRKNDGIEKIIGEPWKKSPDPLTFCLNYIFLWHFCKKADQRRLPWESDVWEETLRVQGGRSQISEEDCPRDRRQRKEPWGRTVPLCPRSGRGTAPAAPDSLKGHQGGNIRRWREREGRVPWALWERTGFEWDVEPWKGWSWVAWSDLYLKETGGDII